MSESLSGSLLAYAILAVIFILFVASSLKIAAEDERFAVFTLGRYVGLKGPGLVFKKPQVDRFTRLAIGDVGELSSPAMAQFHGISVPVSPPGSVTTGDAVRIDGFTAAGLSVTASSQRAATTCPKCGHRF